MAGLIMLNPNPNPDQVFYVDGGQKTLIPPGGSGGVSQANMITALVNAGLATDVRGSMPATTAVYALQAIPWHPNSPTA